MSSESESRRFFFRCVRLFFYIFFLIARRSLYLSLCPSLSLWSSILSSGPEFLARNFRVSLITDFSALFPLFFSSILHGIFPRIFPRLCSRVLDQRRQYASSFLEFFYWDDLEDFDPQFCSFGYPTFAACSLIPEFPKSVRRDDILARSLNHLEHLSLPTSLHFYRCIHRWSESHPPVFTLALPIFPHTPLNLPPEPHLDTL